MATVYADRMANDLFAIGTVQQVVARLHDYVDAGVTIPVIAPLAADADTAATILREIGTHWD
jgi:alkanesulfonate monooxygenase SsuD/methylene tetrahydromethanopterin reductase-like flavin-dependent oxidoreductase (luciferase family)